MEQRKQINGLHVYVSGTWYEISNPNQGGVVEFGDCNPIMTPRQIYDKVFGRPSGDRCLHVDSTLLYMGAKHPYFIHAEYARLNIAAYDMDQEGYQLRYSPPGSNDCRTVTWPARPHILVVDEYIKFPNSSGIHALSAVEMRESIVAENIQPLREILERYGHPCKEM